MPRTKLVNGTEVPLSPAEEAARDALEAEWASGATTRAAKKAYRVALRQQQNSASFDDEEQLVLLAIYAEVKLYRSDNTVDTPLVDAIQTNVFPGQTKAQIGTAIENRVQTFLENTAVALANKIKDGG